MTRQFNERFQITTQDDEARKRFVNRVHNEIYQGIAYNKVHSSHHHELGRLVATHLGDRLRNSYLSNFVGDDFERNLEALEALYAALPVLGNYSAYQREMTELLNRFLEGAEADLQVKWENGLFYPSGAKLLDERLVNDPLHWLRDKKYKSVFDPFEKGLRHLLDARKRPELAEDVITDMYEALEALAGVITARPDKDLSANQELFIKAVKASDAYKKLLKDYIEYANLFRHAKKENQLARSSL